MVITVRVEIFKDDKKIAAMEDLADSIGEALGPLTIKDIANFLVNKRSLLSADIPYDTQSEDLTIKERLASFLRFDERAPQGWFTSSQVKRIYEDTFGGNVRLSTISTYLASMYSDGILERKGSRAMRQYLSIARESTEAASAVV
ncbi:MAG TPA: hypothetical protein VMW40_07565 [Candidatus Bathyarchaeia archaeon]|nr:hypothetical protein [Candidatus Bathyarchaeia archaeon]